MNFEDYLNSTAQEIDQELERILVQFLDDVKLANIKLLPFALGLINSCKGGKRIRGVLVKLGYELATGVIPTDPAKGGRVEGSVDTGLGKTDSSLITRNDILKVSSAFEILHVGFLIHDDIMDRSDLRRGKPTLFKALGGDHYGISQAITLGDIAFFLSSKIIANSGFLGEEKIKALSFLSQILINTGWGQVMDVELSNRQEGVGRRQEDVDFINLYKTAKYTIVGPMQIGAILGGADQELLKKIEKFGENLGIAFQIQDDILDGEVESVENAKSKALEYTLKAKKEIPAITSNDKIRKLLEDMCQFMVERRK